jgi:hypothetical protein
VCPCTRSWAAEHTSKIRVFCISGVGAGNSAEQVTKALACRFGQLKLFQGDNQLDHVTYGESVYGALHDPMFIPKSNPQPQQLEQWRRIATEVAKAGLPLHVHANLTDTISAFLDQIEAIQQGVPGAQPAVGAGARQPVERRAPRADA